MVSILEEASSKSIKEFELPPQYYDDFDSLLKFVVDFPSYKNQSFVNSLRKSPQSIHVVEVNLETLKRFGRSPDHSRLITEHHVMALLNFIEPQYSEKICMEGLSIIANALVVNTTLLNSWDSTEIFNLTIQFYVPRAPVLSPSERYLLRRLGFLFTYRQNKLNEEQIAFFFPLIIRSMSELPRDVSRFSDPAYMPLVKLNSIELLKVTFNVFHHYSDYTLHTLERKGVMNQICKTLIITNTGLVENSDLVRYLFNCLMCSTSPPEWFDTEGEFEDSEDIFENLIKVPSADDYNDLALHKVSSSTLLIRILEFAKLATDPEHAKILLSDVTLSPCLTCLQRVIQKIYSGSAETENEDTPKIRRLKCIAESYLLPSEKEREYPLGSLNAPHSLSNAFVRFSSDISLTTSTAVVQDIYWKLFYGREDLLVGKMGLGFASSFLSTTSTLFSGENKKADDATDIEQQAEVPISRSSTLVSPYNTQRSESNSSKLKIVLKSNDDYKDRSREGSSDLTPSNTYSPPKGNFLDYPSSNNNSISSLEKSDSSTILESLPFFSTSPKPTLAKIKAKTKSFTRGKCASKSSELDSKENEKDIDSNTSKSCGFISKYLPGINCNNSAPPSLKTLSAKKSDSTPDKIGNSKVSISDKSISSINNGLSQGNVKPINIQSSNKSNNINNSGSVSSNKSANVLLYPYLGSSGNDECLKADAAKDLSVKSNDSNVNQQMTATQFEGSIDPITGKRMTYKEFNEKLEQIQQTAKEKSLNSNINDELEWTEEEKEKEAEKMFDLFERLNKNGIIKVGNPSQVFQQNTSSK